MKSALILGQQVLIVALLGYTLPVTAQTALPIDLSSPDPSLSPSPESSPIPSAIPSPIPNPIPPASSPNSQPVTIFENVTLTPAFSPDPETMRGISGGDAAASTLTGRTETATGPCTGFIDQQPDHRMVLTQYFNYLSLQVQSSDDTTLVIRGPGGTWCNDDYSGKNPGVVGQWLSGTYDIWVGSPSENVYHPYVIRLTEQK